QADVLRLLGGDEAAGQDHLVGDPLADRTRETLRAPAPGHAPEVDLGLAEPRRLGRDDDVADHRELAATTEREARHRRDDRLLRLAVNAPLPREELGQTRN